MQVRGTPNSTLYSLPQIFLTYLGMLYTSRTSVSTGITGRCSSLEQHKRPFHQKKKYRRAWCAGQIKTCTNISGTWSSHIWLPSGFTPKKQLRPQIFSFKHQAPWNIWWKCKFSVLAHCIPLTQANSSLFNHWRECTGVRGTVEPLQDDHSWLFSSVCRSD